MKFKYYALFSLLFFIALFGGVYYITMERFDIGLGISLPIALWVVLAVVIFFVFTTCFFAFEWVKTALHNRNNAKDAESIIEQILLQNAAESYAPPRIKDDELARISSALLRYELSPNLASLDSGSARVDRMFELYKSINMGAFEDLRKFKLAPSNPFVLQNWRNYALKGSKNAFEILRDAGKDMELRRFAFGVICDAKKEKDIYKALEVSECLEPKMLQKAFLALIELGEKLESGFVAKLCKEAAFAPKDYVKLAQELSGKLSPDALLALFAALSNADEKAHKAYVLALLELEMIAKAGEELKGFADDEIQGIRAYIELKRAGKSYPLSAFVM